MTLVTSTRIRNFRFLILRCGFLRVEYQSDSTNEKIIENKLDRIEKSNRIDSRKIDRKNMKIDSRKINRNCKCNKIKIGKMKIGLKIVEQIVRIGSALSGLLPSIRYNLIMYTAV